MIRLKLTIPGFEENHIEFYIPYNIILEHSTYRLSSTPQGSFESR